MSDADWITAVHAMFGKLSKDKVAFVQVKHDDWCPKLFSVPGECACRPDVVVTDENTWVAGVERMNRAQRRAAEREARRSSGKGKS
jgi:hypothetical protein